MNEKRFKINEQFKIYEGENELIVFKDGEYLKSYIQLKNKKYISKIKVLEISIKDFKNKICNFDLFNFSISEEKLKQFLIPIRDKNSKQLIEFVLKEYYDLLKGD